MRELKQSTAVNVMLFMADSTDHITGKTGLTLTVTLSKDGGAFASISPTVTERTSGWYNVALTASHTDTLGDSVVRATATGADASERALNVVANVEKDSYDIVAHASYGNAQLVRSTTPGNALDVSATGEAGLDFNNIKDAAGAKTLANITVPVVTTLTDAPFDSSGITTLLSRIASALTITTGKVDVNDKTGFSLSSAGVQAIWDAITSGLTTVGSIGKKLADWVIGTAQTGDSYARLGAPAGASVSADVAAIKSDTGTTLTESQSHPTLAEIEATTVLAKEATVASRLASASYTAPDNAGIAAILDDTGTSGVALSAAAVDAVLDEVVEGNWTLRQLIRLMASTLFTKTSGGGTATLIARDLGDTKARITLTVDANGNRTAVNLDGA